MEELRDLLAYWGFCTRFYKYNPTSESSYRESKILLERILNKIKEFQDKGLSPNQEISLEVIKFSWYHTPFLKVTTYLPPITRENKIILGEYGKNPFTSSKSDS